MTQVKVHNSPRNSNWFKLGQLELFGGNDLGVREKGYFFWITSWVDDEVAIFAIRQSNSTKKKNEQYPQPLLILIHRLPDLI